jgi:tetratricopeptide (TPR) repeat protein
MPLALELAATWVSALSTKEIGFEIEKNLDILAGGLRDIPERQRSIRAVIDHTWRQLHEDERSSLMNLSVFSGGFSKEAGEKVADTSLVTLGSLTQKSLIRRNSIGRYDMHELIRQFAGEKLAESGNGREIRDLHSTYYAVLLKEYEVDLKGGDQYSALRRIAEELDNIRAAWRWAVDHLDYDTIDGLLESFYLYCIFRRGTIDGEKILNLACERLSGRSDVEVQRVSARVTARLEMLKIDKYRVVDLDALKGAGKIIESCLGVARQSGDKSEIAYCNYALGRAEMWMQNVSNAISIFEESLDYSEQINDDFLTAYIYYRLGFCYYLQGEQNKSIDCSEQGLEIARRTGNHYVAAWILNGLAGLIVALGRLEESKQCLLDAISINEELEDKQGAAWSTANLGLLTFRQGKFIEALEISKAAIDLSRDFRDRATTGLTLAVHAWILAGMGETSQSRSFAEEALSQGGISHYVPVIARFALAYSACLDGDFKLVKENLFFAIREFQQRGYNNSVISCLPIVAMVLVNEGRNEEATELLALTLTHPMRFSGWLEKDLLVSVLSKKLKDVLDEDTYSAAWDRGKQLDFDTVVQKIINDDTWG